MEKTFINAGKEFCTIEKHISAPYMRKEFVIHFEPERAEVSVCGLGFYILYINGVNITKGILAPYISNPDHYCYYDTYEISKYLRKGANVIGVILGNGMMNAFGGSVWDFDKASWRNSPIMALELIAEDDKDNKSTINADESFKVHPSPIIFDDLRLGEYYDANLEIEGWNLPGFDDSSWKNAIMANEPKGIMKKCEAEPILKLGEIAPVKILKGENGFIYDFGINSSGLCKLMINANRNQRIVLRYAEVLNEDMEIDRQSITFECDDAKHFSENNQIDIYIAKGEGIEEYVPHFTYHGFRYVEVTGVYEHQATSDLLTYYEFGSELKTIGDFSCSNSIVNKLFEMVKRSDRSNYYYFPVDCPHREKNGWTGDAALSAPHMAMLYDTGKSWREWLNNIRESQTAKGDIPGIVPTDKWGYGEGPAWDRVLFELPYVLFKFRGDTNVIKENADAMINYLKFIENHERVNGLLCFGLGDWLQVGRVCYEYDVPLEVCCEIMVMDMAKKAAEMFNAIGNSDESDYAYELYETEKRLIREKLLDKSTMQILGNTQTGQALALYYGVFEKYEEKAAFDNLLRYIHRDGKNFNCGILGMSVIFHVLSEFGKGDLAFELITKKEYPSYAHLIEMGETALVESFQPNGVSCGSHNHHFLGDIGRWFINRIAGIIIIDSNTIEIRPDFISDIDEATASYELPRGKVFVSWKRTDLGIKMDVSCCEGVEYSIKLPPNHVWNGNYVRKL